MKSYESANQERKEEISVVREIDDENGNNRNSCRRHQLTSYIRESTKKITTSHIWRFDLNLNRIKSPWTLIIESNHVWFCPGYRSENLRLEMKELSPTVAELATGNKQINLLPTAAAATNLKRFKEPTFSLSLSWIFFSFSSIEKQQIALLRRLQSSSRKINSRKTKLKERIEEEWEKYKW